MIHEQDVQKLLNYITSHFGIDPERWFHPEGYQSIALAILDSIYSTGNRYTGVLNLVNRHRGPRANEGSHPEADTATDLIETFYRWGGDEEFVLKTNNRWRTSSQLHAPIRHTQLWKQQRYLLVIPSNPSAISSAGSIRAKAVNTQISRENG